MTFLHLAIVWVAFVGVPIITYIWERVRENQ